MNDNTLLDFAGDLLPGLLVSFQLTVATLVFGIPLGIVLALGLRETNMLVRAPAMAVVEIGRGFPVLVILYLMYFGLPQVSITPTAMIAAVAGLAISFGAYTSEAFRAGLAAVPVGQYEAGLSIGLSVFALYRKVLLPQAIKIVVPPLIGWSIVYFQTTSLAYAIAVPELMSRAYTLATSNFQYLYMLGLAAFMYAAVSIPLSLISERLNNRSPRKARTIGTTVATPTL
ncbi:amino acid ABC transporter permease [Rhodococcus sp. NBC_00294]|uniref:amino acid ABC transporter permease n=1 Tax=Rhodococcus sp. NBC_00294 TaxID=2976004 RepID=UPI002E2E844D|nr:amino acid ABC transporter permease [Rhodococcus sp. NBC_00294]